jgi:hypothetical protein
MGTNIQTSKHSKLQTYRDLRSNLTFSWYLAEPMKCFDISLFNANQGMESNKVVKHLMESFDNTEIE